MTHSHVRQNLMCVAACCSVLQCVAVCCSVVDIFCFPVLSTFLSHMWHDSFTICGMIQSSGRQSLRCVAVCCSVLQCVAVCCSVLQCVAVCCSVLQRVAVCWSVLQCVAVCCSMLQCAAVSLTPSVVWNFLSHMRHDSCTCVTEFDVCCSVLQHFAVGCSVLQWVEVWLTYYCCLDILVTHVIWLVHTIWHDSFKCETEFDALQCVAVCCSVLQCAWHILLSVLSCHIGDMTHSQHVTWLIHNMWHNSSKW